MAMNPYEPWGLKERAGKSGKRDGIVDLEKTLGLRTAALVELVDTKDSMRLFSFSCLIRGACLYLSSPRSGHSVDLKHTIIYASTGTGSPSNYGGISTGISGF